MLCIENIDKNADSCESYGASKTKIPVEFEKQQTEGSSYYIWDCPGFFDTEGVEQENANAFYNLRLIENIKKIKILLVVS